MKADIRTLLINEWNIEQVTDKEHNFGNQELVWRRKKKIFINLFYTSFSMELSSSHRKIKKANVVNLFLS